MQVVEIKSQVKMSLEEILNGVSKLETPDLELFLSEVSQILAIKKASNYSKRELQLLQLVNQHLPEQEIKRYQFLSNKLQEENISDVEHQELLVLVEKIEIADAKQLGYLIELARLKKISLAELKQELNLISPNDA